MSLSACAEYRYQPLQPRSSEDQRIRLMTLHPGIGFADIQCSLQEVSISTAGDFQAISYVCGPPDLDHDLYCDGKRLLITENLHIALRHVRNAQSSLILWTDAVCIHQRDTKEKEKQIQLLSSIYEAATSTLVFLGEVGEYSGSQVERLFERAKLFGPIQSGPVQDERSFEALEAQKKLLNFRKQSNSTGLQGARNLLFSRPWFKRLWTYQEVLLSKRVIVQCGRSTATWEDLKPLIPQLSLATHGKNLSVSPLNLAAARFYIKDALTRVGYLTLLPDAELEGDRKDVVSKINETTHVYVPNMIIALKRLESAMVQDKIIGALSILKKLNIRTPPPEYDLDIRRLFAAGTRSWALSRGSVNCLGLAATPKENDNTPKDLPSWVIDWTASNDEDTHYVTHFLQVNDYHWFVPGNKSDQISATSESRSFIDLEMHGKPQSTELELTIHGITAIGNNVEQVVRFVNPSYAKAVVVSKFIRNSDGKEKRLSRKSKSYRTLVCWLTCLADGEKLDAGCAPAKMSEELILFADLVHRRFPRMYNMDCSGLVHGKHGLETVRNYVRMHVITSRNMRVDTGEHFARDYSSAFEKVLVDWESHIKSDGVQCRHTKEWKGRIDDRIDKYKDMSQVELVRKAKDELTRHLEEILFCETLIVTSTGRVGMCLCRNIPTDTGDIVALVQGSDYPLILRQAREPNQYQFIGMAFVSGLMDGEAWPKDTNRLHDITLV